MIDAAEVAGRSGWRVFAHAEVTSTNDEAARLRDLDAGDGETGSSGRQVVVAGSQTAGRGRGGNRFASPAGGLYASLLVGAQGRDLPGPLVLALGVASADAIEACGGGPVSLKWPNDLWIGGRKVGGLLLEAAPRSRGGAGAVAVVVGVGINVGAVPSGLPPDVAAASTSLAAHPGDARAGADAGRAAAPPRLEDLLVALLAATDARLAALADPQGRVGVEAAYRSRAALLGERVTFVRGSAPATGVLRDVSLDRGLLLEEPPGAAPRWTDGAHLRDVRRASA